ncbi:MAG: hypothetical protein N4A70_06060 [Pelagimonas sp.]|nr:hypothetical protein [Pelagimonas sp.]
MSNSEHTLISAFAPPEGFSGDFGVVCGFTASHAALSEISRTFSGDGTRPHLAAFIHPTADAVTDVPGVAWMHFHKTPFALLHAKVALLGFQGMDNRYLLRLLVSTGNWTQEPLTTSFDMYWFDDFEIGHQNPQLCADLLAAADLFKWLRSHCDTRVLAQRYDGAKPAERWQNAIKALPKSDRTPRFIDTRAQTMMDQVIDRVPKKLNAKRLVLGSGYFEAPNSSKGGLISEIPKRLKSRLSKDAALDLALNPESCQGVSGQAPDLVKAGWRIRGPRQDNSGRKLHAKFMLLTEQDTPKKIGKSFLYLGSGNFSRKGFASHTPNGNLEAGIVLQPDADLSWRKGARQDIKAKIPANFDGEVALQSLEDGADFQEPVRPEEPPIVPFVIWKDGVIHAPDDIEEKVAIEGKDGNSINLPAQWSGPVPSFVTLTSGRWKVPVYASGAFVTPRPTDMTIDDIIANLHLFPAPPEPRDGEDFEYTEETEQSFDTESSVQVYPLRRMMRLIVHMTETQRCTSLRDWPRWCREISQTLPVLAKTEQTMLEPFQRANRTPLTALLNSTFIPTGADRVLLETAVDHINHSWGLKSAHDLWSEENA